LVKERANKLKIHSDLDPRSGSNPGFLRARHCSNRVEPAAFENNIWVISLKKNIFMYPLYGSSLAGSTALQQSAMREFSWNPDGSPRKFLLGESFPGLGLSGQLNKM
jgi:hypothetical protein